MNTNQADPKSEILQGGLFSEQRLAKATGPSPESGEWQLASNHQNMLYMLASGLLTGPAGFSKYYNDCLATLPGNAPLFRNAPPADLLDAAVHEQSFLHPCIASFSLVGLNGDCHMPCPSVHSGVFPSDVRGDDQVILLPLPLPMSMLRKITFRSGEGEKAFRTAASYVSNIQLQDVKLIVDASMFSEPPIKYSTAGVHSHDITPAFGQALGGAIAMLYHIANRSPLAAAAYRMLASAATEADQSLLHRDTILATLGDWLKSGGQHKPTDISAELYWQVVSSLIQTRNDGSGILPVDAALATLTEALPKLNESTFQTRLRRLIEDMRSCARQEGGTVSEILDRNKGPLSHSMLLFCLRDNCEELLEFSSTAFIGDTELVLSALLFGVRESWFGLPNALRQPDSLPVFVAHHMAAAEIRLQAIRMLLPVAPPRPVPLAELFPSSTDQWSSQQQETAKQLARKCGWQDCLKTRIRLGKGDYHLEVSTGGMQIVLDGEVSAVTTELDTHAFHNHLGAWPPPDAKHEQQARKSLIKKDKN